MEPSANCSPTPPAPAAGPSLWADAWLRFKRHRLAYLSLWVLGLLVLAVLLGPFVYKVGIKLESFLAIIGALYTCYDPIKKLGSLSNEMARGQAALERIEAGPEVAHHDEGFRRLHVGHGGIVAGGP